MRWLGGITLIIAGLAAAIAGIGALLPATLSVEATDIIDRPRATVYALASNLAAVQEFLPLNERDPQATMTLTGEGADQVLRWSSRLPLVGEGALTIAGAVPMEQVEYAVRPAAGAPARLTLSIKPVGADVDQAEASGGAPAVEATWRFVSSCEPTWRGLPCRYANLFSRGPVRRDLEVGLRRLDRIAAQAPEADFEGLVVQPAVARPATFAFVERTVSSQPGQAEEAVLSSVAAVRAYLAKAELSAIGPALVQPMPSPRPDVLSFRAGAPFSGPAPLASTEVKVGRLPEGRALKVIHAGPYSSRGETYARFEAYLAAHRLQVVGEPWEVIVAAPASSAAQDIEAGGARDAFVVEIWRRIEA